MLIYYGYNGGEKVRVAAFALSLAGTSARGTALVKVAETLTHRMALAEQATLAIVVPMLLMTLAAAAAIAYGVGRGLALLTGASPITAGIAAHHREAVLAPFHRLSDRIEGAGVGLTLVARIVRLHDATLQLESVPAGKGLSVRIAFPAAPSSA